MHLSTRKYTYRLIIESARAKVSAITRRALNDLLPQHEGRNCQHHGEAGAHHPGDHSGAEIFTAATHQGRYLVAIAGDQYLRRCRALTLNETAVYCAPGSSPYDDLVNGVHRQVGYDRLHKNKFANVYECMIFFSFFFPPLN